MTSQGPVIKLCLQLCSENLSKARGEFELPGSIPLEYHGIVSDKEMVMLVVMFFSFISFLVLSLILQLFYLVSYVH